MPRGFQYISVKTKGFSLLNCIEGMLQTAYSGERGQRSDTKTIDSGQESRSKSRLAVSITYSHSTLPVFNYTTKDFWCYVKKMEFLQKPENSLKYKYIYFYVLFLIYIRITSLIIG